MAIFLCTQALLRSEVVKILTSLCKYLVGFVDMNKLVQIALCGTCRIHPSHTWPIAIHKEILVKYS